MDPRSPTRAFTLLELLVSISILAILASLLAPALTQARRRADAAQCLGQLRRLAMATQLYWDDHDNRPFPYLLRRNAQGATYWFGWIGQGVEGARAFDASEGPLSPYLQPGGIGHCPSWKGYETRAKAKTLDREPAYGYNRHLVDDGVLSASREPGQRALFGDAAQINDFQHPASPDRPMLEAFYYVSVDPWDYPNVHFRHRQRAHFAFADGHSEPVSPAPNSWDERGPQWRVGRVRARLLRPPEALTIPRAQSLESTFRVGGVGQ